jgi:NADH:ubiquinone reductase (H+-translocating)
MADSTQTRMQPTLENRPGPQTSVSEVVIVGGGFGGLAAAKKLARRPVHVTVIDRTNYHLFQPMLYQVATTALMPADIAAPLRDILRRQKNTDIVMAEVTGVDTEQQLVLMGDNPPVHYDYLILATGASTNYFRHPEWENIAPGMKSLDDAVTIKNTVWSTLEAAEREPDEEKRKALLTLVLVGGGATGVELAAMFTEHKHMLSHTNFRHVRLRDIRIILVEGGPRLVAAFLPSLSEKVQQRLTKKGVEVRTNAQVKEVTDDGVMIGDEFVPAKTVIWVAGVKASPAGQWLHAETDRSGRVKVQDDLSVPGHPNIFVIGDTAEVMQKGQPLPGLAQPALQGGHYVASVISDRIAGKEHQEPFKYFDKGSLAVVGRSYAIFESGPVQRAGFFAWLIWIFVHIYFLIGFRDRFVVLWKYLRAYFDSSQHSVGARLIYSGRPIRTFEEHPVHT